MIVVPFVCDGLIVFDGIDTFSSGGVAIEISNDLEIRKVFY
jgi:hypothetical protein